MSYIGNQPVLQTTQFRDEFPVTASTQTAFITGGFHPSAVSVFRNGVLLSEDDYVKGSDNVTITLNNAAVSGDIVVIEGNRSLAQGVSVSESRVEYTWQSGDTYVQLNTEVIPAYTDVYLNGVKLAVADYSINASTRQVSFTSAPAVGDVIAVVHRNETSALVGLPLKDSSGAAILSESAGSVVLANVDTATIGSNALVVDASGNVGVGTTPSVTLDVNLSSGDDVLHATGGRSVFTSASNGNGAVVNCIGTPPNYFFDIRDDNSPIFRVDGSGNVLVGDTTGTVYDSTSETGLNFTNNGSIYAATSGNNSAILNRIGSDGEIVQFRKNGTTVGSIGSVDVSGYKELYICGLTPNTLRVGFLFDDVANAIKPCQANGASRDDAIDLGQLGNRFDDIYATNNMIQTSDRNEKENITSSDLSLNFIKQLNPVSYRFIGKTRTHYGLIAQEIETLLSAVGKETTDFAGFIKSPVTDEDGNETGEYKYGLRYSEFISPMIKAIQEQQTIIESQQFQIDALTARIEALEATTP